MSDISSSPKFTFGDVEKYIKDNLSKVYGGSADNHMKNSMLNEKSFALHSKKEHILRIIIRTDGATADIASNVKNNMAKNMSAVLVSFLLISKNTPKRRFLLISRRMCEKCMLFKYLASVTAKCDWKYGTSDFCSHVCSILYRLTSDQLRKLDYLPDEDFSSTMSTPSSIDTTSKGYLYQACAADVRCPSDLDLLK